MNPLFRLHLAPPASKPQWRNWAGTTQCEPNHTAEPLTLEEIQAEVLRAAEEGERLRVIGSGASYAPLCWTDDNHMSLARFTGIDSADVQRRRVWVRAGTTLAELTEQLAERDLALETAPSTDGLSIGGAIGTGTHGSGMAFGNLSSMVTGLRLVLADGSLRSCSREQLPELFDAARVSLGALGVITHVELQCVDHYRLRVGEKRVSFGEALTRLHELRSEHRSLDLMWFPYAHTVRLHFTDETRETPPSQLSWQTLRRQFFSQVYLRGMRALAKRSQKSAERASAMLATRRREEVLILNAEHAYAAPRRTPVEHLEYAIPAPRLPEVLRQLDRLTHALALRVHVPVEIRYVRADDAWLSPQYQRDSACISVPAYREQPHADYYAAVTEIFDRVQGRPHWASPHDKTAAELRTLYPRFDDFCKLREDLDPRGLFLNPHLARLFGARLR